MMTYNCPYCNKEYSFTQSGVLNLYEYCTCGNLFKRTFTIFCQGQPVEVSKVEHAFIFKSAMETTYHPQELSIVSSRKIEIEPKYSCNCDMCRSKLKRWLVVCADPSLDISDDYLPTYSGLFLLTLDHYEDHIEDEWEEIMITDWRKS